VLAVISVGACSFPRPLEQDTDGSPGADGPRVPSCTPGLGFLDLCSQPEPTEALVLAPGADDPIDTERDARCRPVAQANGPELCLLYFTDVEIRSGVEWLVVGARPLALAATRTMKIAGTLDLSSRRDRLLLPGAGSNPAAGLCSSMRDPADSEGAGGGGGGAGGTLGAAGGNGGVGANGARDGGLPEEAIATSAILRGGCDGQPGGAGGGAGGDKGLGGGAVYLAASSIQISGSVLASGSGGGGAAAFFDGGGGGGSGGMIVVQSASLQVSGLLLATGGGGGQGGDNNSVGAGGADPVSAAAAAGGTGINAGGPGGAGGTDLAGSAGSGHLNGGGGGGGGAGIIRLLSAEPSTAGATIMPPVPAPPS
jgi:hypothetical protein